MSDSEILDNIDNINFPIITADGAYSHFLDGFVSLLFYQVRIIPKDVKKDQILMHKNREYIAEIRLSVDRLKQLMQELDDGLKMYPMLGLLQNKTDFYTGGVNAKAISESKIVTSTYLADKEEERIIKNLILETGKDLSKEGRKKYEEEIVKILIDNVDRLREISRNDQKENGELKEKKNAKSRSK